jgi:predicted kinase
MKAFVMVGAPGAGKSTLATRLAENENAFVISGDEVRAELYGDAANQGNWEEINDRIEELVSEAVGTPVILDGTHYLSSYRKEAQALLRSYGYDEVEAVVVNPPLEDCIFRNANRHRGVPRHVVLNMHEKLQKSLEFIGTEGFSQVTWAV